MIGVSYHLNPYSVFFFLIPLSCMRVGRSRGTESLPQSWLCASSQSMVSLLGDYSYRRASAG